MLDNTWSSFLSAGAIGFLPPAWPVCSSIVIIVIIPGLWHACLKSLIYCPSSCLAHSASQQPKENEENHAGSKPRRSKQDRIVCKNARLCALAWYLASGPREYDSKRKASLNHPFCGKIKTWKHQPDTEFSSKSLGKVFNGTSLGTETFKKDASWPRVSPLLASKIRSWEGGTVDFTCSSYRCRLSTCKWLLGSVLWSSMND